jgi:hypothetical protein
MNSGARHKKQRSTRVRLKADAHYLLNEIIVGEYELPFSLTEEIREMMGRLQPKPGVAARIELTAYTKESKSNG